MVENNNRRPSLLTLPEELSRLGESWGWFLAAGIGYIIIGLIAVDWPVTSTVGLTFALGVLFVIGGLLYGIQTIQLRTHAGTGWRVFQSVAALAAGVLILRYPGSGMIGVAIAMAFYFFVSAAAKSVLAFGLRPLKGWGWALASAIASLGLGVYIVAAFPFSALWVPGLLLGIDLVVHGCGLIGFSSDLRTAHKKGKDAPERVSESQRAA